MQKGFTLVFMNETIKTQPENLWIKLGSQLNNSILNYTKNLLWDPKNMKFIYDLSVCFSHISFEMLPYCLCSQKKVVINVEWTLIVSFDYDVPKYDKTTRCCWNRSCVFEVVVEKVAS